MIHLAAALLVLSLVCLGLFGLYPLVTGDGIDTFAITGSVEAVGLSAALVGVVARWRL